MALDSGFPAGMTRFLGLAEASANQHILAVKINEILTIKQDLLEHYYD
jgi:hypothetical protein